MFLILGVIVRDGAKTLFCRYYFREKLPMERIKCYICKNIN